jgi:hypothetical protein
LVVRILAAILMSAGVLAVSCSSKVPSCPTHGKVVYKGTDRPFNQGWICLECTQPPYTRLKAQLNENGEFQVGAPVGEHRACLEPGSLGATRAGMTAYLKQVDQKYTVYATSGWKLTVVPNQENNFTLHVTKPGEK